LLSHFLLHCDTGLKVAQIARLLKISRPHASKAQGLSSKQVIQLAHHRLDGRPYGKLLPRYAGPIAAFLLAHPDATRGQLLDFIERTFSVRVSRIALYKFLKKYGLQDVCVASQSLKQPGTPCNASAAAVATATLAAPVLGTSTVPNSMPLLPAPLPVDQSPAAILPAAAVTPVPVVASVPVASPAAVLELAGGIEPLIATAPPFCSDGRSTPAPGC
jgi:hypothetical protein